MIAVVSREIVGVSTITSTDIAAMPGAARNGVNMCATIARRIVFATARSPSFPSGRLREPHQHSPRLHVTITVRARTYGELAGAIHHNSGVNARNPR